MADSGVGFKKRPVRILREDVARRIAAGEVIDRPSAIVRELMDNAVDSGADSVNVEITGGGIESVKVSDNGAGMTRDDLENCANPHATSKIVEAEDLSKLTTLGFRGEALASIAAVGILTINSGNLKMTLSNSTPRKIEPTSLFQGGKGTSVSGADLFADFPARRVFLKRPASETMMCRETFVEKALARPDISFRLIVDGTLRLNLPANVSRAERFSAALEIKENINFLHEINSNGKEPDGKSEWKFSLVIGDPAIRRNDKRNLFIYVNGRRVQEYSLLQAIEYGCQGFFPNGTHPIAALFAQVDPSLVDFNIHPAKKEVKFKDITALHHGISSSIRNFFKSLTTLKNQQIENENNELDFETNIEKDAIKGILSSTLNNLEDEKDGKDEKDGENAENELKSDLSKTEILKESSKILDLEATGFLKIAENLPEPTKSENKKEKTSDLRSRFFNFDTSREKRFENIIEEQNIEPSSEYGNEIKKTATKSELNDFENIRYIGRTMETFIIVERKNVLYMIDQHAAHERMIFDKMMNNEDISTKGRQTLLIPYTIETDDEEEEKYIESILPRLDESGFSGKKVSDGTFDFNTTPTRWTGTLKDFRDALLDEMIEPSRIMYKIFATAACRKAVMQGTPLDDKTAEKIARNALALPDPHCPHGRPIWFTLTKEQMFSRVRRTEN